MATNRVKYFDIARGIAIICIILGHLGNENINRVVFTFHVPIFLLISGYFISDKLTIVDFIKRKFKTLIVPYFITSILMIVLAAMKSILMGESAVDTAMQWVGAMLYGAGDNFGNVLGARPIGALWFLLATFWANVFLRILLNVKPYVRVILVLLLFAFGYVTSHTWFWFPLAIQAGCCATLFLYIGYLVRKIEPIFAQLITEVKIVAVLFSLAIWIEFVIGFKSFWLVHCDVGRGVVDIVGSVCGCFLLILCSQIIEKHTRHITNILSFLGKYSLIVLCIHNIEFHIIPWDIVNTYCLKISQSNGLAFLMMIVVKLVLIISLTFCCSKSMLVKKAFGLIKE